MRLVETEKAPLRGTPPESGQPASPPPSSASTAVSGSTTFVMGAINSAIALVKSPVTFMTSDKDAPATDRSIMINYVAVLAAIPFFATLIGNLWYYGLFARFFGSSVIGYAIVSAILVYILDVVAVYVVGIVIRTLATNFSSSNDPTKALKLSSYIFTPVFLISVLNIIPLLGVLTFLGVLYGLYILYLGLPIVLGTPKEKVVPYLVATVVAILIVYVVIAVIVGLVSAAFFLTRYGFLF